MCPQDPLQYRAEGFLPAPLLLTAATGQEIPPGVMPEPGREVKALTEIDSSIFQGWELPSHAGMCAMLVSMETQHKMYFHRGATSDAEWTAG